MNLTLDALRKAYANNEITPAQLVSYLNEKADDYEDHHIWIHHLSETELTPYLDALSDKSFDSHPLWGTPFAIKDNIDLAGIPTTAACREFSYTPTRTATVVQRLIDAGAIPLGKTNMDQFATGLNGTRSPFGACKNAFDPNYISGGSSSGSAVAVALGLATFSLGTDTAGSGRVPAGFNNLVGLKPSRGLLSNHGVVRACRSLDCVSLFTLTTDDANTVFAVAEGQDPEDEYSRKNPFANRARHYGKATGTVKIGLLPQAQLEFFGDQSYATAYRECIDHLSQLPQSELTIEFTEIDYAPFLEAARLLYEGPWVSERYLGALPLSRDNPAAMLDVIQSIIEPATRLPATDAFEASYRLQALKNQCLSQLESLDCLLVPTTTTHYTIDEIHADPIGSNSRLGQYTNFVNLLDMCALALPAGFTTKQLPFGITLIADHFHDRHLLSIANTIQQTLQLPLGATQIPLAPTGVPATTLSQESVDVVVCGAHLEGLPLNWQLTERGARLIEKTETAPCYRLYALAGGPPQRPGLVYDKQHGTTIEVEVWSVPTTEFGSFVAGIPSPLGIGKVKLKDQSERSGFICEPFGIEDATEITHYRSWRHYLDKASIV